jgi:hypothetical protein
MSSLGDTLLLVGTQLGPVTRDNLISASYTHVGDDDGGGGGEDGEPLVCVRHARRVLFFLCYV